MADMISAGVSFVWLALGAVALWVRVEVTRAVLRRDVDALQRQRNEDLERLDKRLDEIAHDIKTLLARQ